MAKNTKDIIVDRAYELFRAKGYNATSMREIADAAGITVGNLCYHFPKKEDLFYTYYTRIFPMLTINAKDSWVSFFSREYVILYKFFMDSVYVKQYTEAIDLPTLRVKYCQDFYNRLLEQIQKTSMKLENEVVYDYAVVFCSTELHLFEAHIGQGEKAFENYFTLVLKVILNLLDLDESIIKDVLKVSKKYLKDNPSLMNF